MAFSVTVGHNISGDSSITKAELHNAIENLTIAGVTQNEIDATAASVCAIQGSAPSSPNAGWLWYDTALDLLRQYDTKDGITGWHPVSGCHALMTNRSGASVDSGDVLVRAPTHAPDTDRQFATTTSVKDQGVFAVARETIADDGDGVVALVTGGAVVDVNVQGSTHGAVAKGDLLVTYSVAGEARTVGAAPGTGHPSEVQIQYGLPVGAFAEALVASSADEAISCRLLGQVGQGCYVQVAQTSIWRYLTTIGGYQVVDCSATASGTAGGQNAAGTALIDTDHAPLLAADLTYNLVDNPGGSSGSRDIRFSKDGSTINRRFQHWFEASTSTEVQAHAGLIGTSIGDGTAANNNVVGDKVFVENNAVMDETELFLEGYIY